MNFTSGAADPVCELLATPPRLPRAGWINRRTDRCERSTSKGVASPVEQ
jgi:hypothetical protein